MKLSNWWRSQTLLYRVLGLPSSGATETNRDTAVKMLTGGWTATDGQAAKLVISPDAYDGMMRHDVEIYMDATIHASIQNTATDFSDADSESTNLLAF